MAKTRAEQAQDASVQARATGEGLGLSLMLWAHAGGSDLIAPWWSRTRDAQLRSFWKTVDHLAGAVYTMESRLKTIPFHVQPRDFAVKSHQRQAEEYTEILMNESDFSAGWGDFYSKFVEDLITLDNGSFAEILGDGKPDGPIIGRPYGIAALDGWRCQRTSDPEFPVLYQSQKGKIYKLHYTRVLFAAQQPSPAEEMLGVGFSCVSRCINVAQTLLDQLVYKSEKLGSRPKRALMVTSGGLDPEDIRTALALADQDMNNQALRRYSKIPTVGSRDITEAKLELVDMVSLPDGFDWKSDTTLSMAAISLAFGLDARELFPGLEAGATRAEALIAHIKQRGKGPGDILETTERLINAKFLPRHLQMVFDFQDDEQDRQRADIKNLRATRYVNLSVAGLLDPRTMREQMLDEGDLSQAQFERLELEEGRLVDGSDVLTLFANPELQDMLSLGVDNPTDLEVNEAAVMLAAIQDRQRMLTAQLSGANPGEAQRIRQALAALDRLKMLYGGRSAQATAPKAPAQRRAEEGQALLESDTGIMPPFSAEDLEFKMGTDGWRDRLLRNARKGKAIRQVVNALTDNGREPPLMPSAVSFESISGSSKSVDEASEDGPVKWAVVKALQRLFKPESIPAPTPVSTSIPKVKLDVHLHQGDQVINLPSPPAVENKVDIHLPESPPPVVNVGPTPITIENKVDVPPAQVTNVVEPAQVVNIVDPTPVEIINEIKTGGPKRSRETRKVKRGLKGELEGMESMTDFEYDEE